MSNVRVGLQIALEGDKQAQQGLQRVKDGLGGLDAGLVSVDASAGKTAASLSRMNTSVGDIAKGVIGAQLLASGLQAVASAATALPRSAFDYTKELEASSVGMAGILGSMAAMNGKQLEYHQGLAISQDMIRKLGDDALRTAASSQELTSTFQALLAPGLAAKMTLDEIRQLTVTGVNAVKSIGLSGAQVVQELRDLVAGGITASGSQLATALGLKDADIAKAKASSEGLFSFLMERLRGFEESSSRFGDTLQGRMDALKEGSTRVAAEGMKPLTDEISRTIGELGKLFVTFEKTGEAKLNPEIIASLRGVSEGLVSVMDAGKSTAAVLYENREAVGGLVAAYAAFKVGSIAAEMVQAVQAKTALAQASRLAAVQSAVESAANESAVLTSRQKTAAILAELQANVQRTAAQVAATAGTVAATQAERAHALAVTQLTAAQNAASVSGRAMGAVMGALGGPVGIAVTAFASLVGYMMSANAEAEKLAKVGQSKDRVDAASAAGQKPEDRDISRLQAQLAQLKETRDELLLDQKDGGIMRFIFGKDYDVGLDGKLRQNQAAIDGLEKSLAAAKTVTESTTASTGTLTLTLSGAEQAWRKSIDGVKTASSIQADYQDKLAGSQRAHATYIEELKKSGASEAALQKAKVEQGQAEASLLKQRDEALKGLTKTQGASTTALENERVSLLAKLKAEQAYAAALATRGLQADKMTEADKSAERYALQAAKAKDARTAATYKGLEAMAREIAVQEQANAVTSEALKAHQALLDAMVNDTKAITDRASAVEAENAVFGKSRAAIEAARLAAEEQRREDIAFAADPAYLQAMDDRIAAMRRYVQALQEADYKQVNARTDEILRAAGEQAKLYGDEVRLAGLTGLERAKIVAQRQVEIKYAKELAAIDASNLSDTEKATQRQKLLEAQQIESSAAVAKVVQEDWAKTSDQINQSLTDALMRGFESGKGFLRNLGDTAVNLFKSMVLRPTITAAFTPVAAGINSAFGINGGSPGGGGIAGNISTGASVYNAATGSMASGFANGLSAWGAEGSVTGVLSNPGLYTGAELAGAVAPIALAAVAIAAFAKSLDNSGTFHTGALSQYSAAGGTSTSYQHGAYGMGFGGVEASTKTAELTSGIAQSIVKMLDSTATTFGKEAGYKAATAFADDSSKDGAWGGLLISKLEDVIINWDTSRTSKWAPKEFADGEAGMKEYLAAIAGSARDALDSIGLPEWAQSIVSKLGEGATLEQLGQAVDQINATQTAIVSMGERMAPFAGMTDGMVTALINAAGGIQQLSTSAASYYENFYSQAEKTAFSTEQVAKELESVGLVIPKTRQEFRALIESQQKLGTAGAPAVATLLKVSGAFAQLVPAAEDAAAAAEAVKVATKDYLGDFLKTVPDTLTSTIAGIMAGKEDALKAGAELGQSVADGITESILMGGASQISAAFMANVIQPIVANVAASRAMLDGVDLAGGVAAAKDQMMALRDTLADPQIAGAIREISGAVGELVGAAQSAAGGIKSAGGAPGIYGGGFGGSEFNAPMPGSFGGTASGDFASAGQYAFALPGYAEYQAWVDSHRNLTPNYNGGASFAIGGTVPIGNPVYEQINYINKELFTYLGDQVAQTNQKIADVLNATANPVAKGIEKINDEFQQIFKDAGGASQDAHVKFLETRIDEVRQIKEKIPGALSAATQLVSEKIGEVDFEIKNTYISVEDRLKSFSDAGVDIEKVASDVAGIFSGIPHLNFDPEQIKSILLGELNPQVYFGAEQSLKDAVDLIIYGGGQHPGLISVLQNPFGDFRSLESNLASSKEGLDALNEAMRSWRVSQLRLLATEELATLAQETQSAIEKTAELRRTGGLEDPITKLNEAFAQKIKTVDDGVGKMLLEEIDTLKNTKNPKAEAALASLAQERKYWTEGDQRLKDIAALQKSLANLGQSYSKALTDAENAHLNYGSTEDAISAINADLQFGIDVGSKIEGIAGEIKNLEDVTGNVERIDAAMEAAKQQILAATDPAKRAALQAEIDTYKGGITEWFKAQAELLSTEMLVDINAQIRELEKADQGPLTAIKAAIDKYVTDLKVLDQYTAAAQASVDQLAGLQLTKARDELYAQLVPQEEQNAKALAGLKTDFAALGKVMPETAAALRVMIDAASGDLKDKLLELVPAFVALQPAAEGAAASAETVAQAYARLRTVTRTAEQVAQERIDLEERLFAATASQAEIANLARLRIDEYNRALYDQVIAAEAAQQAVQDTRTATDQALAEVRRLIGEEITRLQGSFKVTDTAYSAVERAVAAQKSTLTEQLNAAKQAESAINGIFGALRDNLRDMRGEVESTTRMQAAEGQQVIRAALATGVLPEQERLQQAIQAARAGLDATKFATATDRDRAYIALQNELEALQRLAQPQLSAAEQSVALAEEQIDKLDLQLKSAKALVDQVRGVDTRVLGVQDAIGALESAVATEAAARDQIAVLNGQLEVAQGQYEALRGIKTGVDAIAPALQALADAIAGEQSAAANAAALAAAAAAQRQAITAAAGGQYGASLEYVRDFGAGSAMADTSYANQREADIASLYQNVLGRTADSGGLAYYAGTAMSIAEIAASLEASREDDIRDTYGGAAQQAFNDQVNKALGLESDIRIPGFAVGASVIPQDMLAMVHKGEQIIPAPWNPATSGLLRQGGSDPRVADLISQLIDRVGRLERELARRLDEGNNNTDGINTRLRRVSRDSDKLYTTAA